MWHTDLIVVVKSNNFSFDNVKIDQFLLLVKFETPLEVIQIFLKKENFNLQSKCHKTKTLPDFLGDFHIVCAPGMAFRCIFQILKQPD